MIDWEQRLIDDRLREKDERQAEARESIRLYQEWRARQDSGPSNPVIIVFWLLLGTGFVIISPLALGIAIIDWYHVWRHGRAPSPFVQEHPDSARAWAETMERGRQLQAEEERDG